MKVVQLSRLPKEPHRLVHLFTGLEVTKQTPFPESQDYDVSLVNFGKGVRNKFHAHSCEQLLIVTAGKGIVATDEGQRLVTPGDVILIGAGEKHWHGATEDTDFSHLYLTKAGSTITQLEE
jgi:quercetin dioxygenase-like cupin family protein